MSKLTCVVSCPIDTYSGYGARSRDFVKALSEGNPDWNVLVLPQRWGSTRMGYLEDHKELSLKSRIIPRLTEQPDIWIQISVPNEFQKVGKYNIGVTAGIETTLAHAKWIQGCNNMDLILVSAEHGKKVLQDSKFEIKDNRTGQVQGHVELTTPIEVLFEGVDLNKYFKKPTTSFDLSDIKENFCYLVVGHWLPGAFGQDRKNIGFTVKSFLETFKNKQNQPALILKTQQSNSSIMDREAVLDKIDQIKKSVRGTLPNIYLIHGEISDEEINNLYNHPKVKVLVSHTRGEGFGRPLLEFSVTGKPIIATNWSGHTDFLDTDLTILLGGQLERVHKSAAQKEMILEEAHWFTADSREAGIAYKETFKHYKKYLNNAKRQAYRSKDQFSYEKMVERLKYLMSEYIPKFPEKVDLDLPDIKIPTLKREE